MPRRGTEISGSAAAAALPLLKAAEAGDALEVRPGSPWLEVKQSRGHLG
jgi:hypothetical protein